ncbi:MAG: DUF1361 domain-containing protein [Candidatus Daviesbacteria bacterium]|nr:DUF1361 domain-containing protein [Candidatus Daviesbacteria bacterium]
MNILVDNIEWMTFNIILALIAVILGIIFLYINNKLLKILVFIVWMLYLPNTIYLITDTQHFSDQWLKLPPSLHLVLVVQYIVLILIGIATFLLGIYLLDKFFSTSKIKKNKILINILLIITNYVLAFGVALGRIYRLNSYEVFTQPQKVISGCLSLLTSAEAMIAIFIFGTFTSYLYFFLRKKINIKM